MKVVKVSISALRPGEIVSGSVTTQRKRGDTWIVEDVLQSVSGQPDAERTFTLDDTQRLIIEGSSDMEVVYDKEQNAAVARPAVRPLTATIGSDGDEDTGPSLIDKAMRGPGLTALQEQERRDRAITEARQKVEAQRKADAEKAEADRQKANEPPIGGAPSNPLTPKPFNPSVSGTTTNPDPLNPKPKVQF